MAVSPGLAERVISFRVAGNLTNFSDHKPCHWTLDLNHDLISGEELLARLQNAPIKYKLSNETGGSEKQYLEAQDCPATCDKLKALQTVCCQTPEDVKNLNNQDVDTLKDVADKVLLSNQVGQSWIRTRIAIRELKFAELFWNKKELEKVRYREIQKSN